MPRHSSLRAAVDTRSKLKMRAAVQPPAKTAIWKTKTSYIWYIWFGHENDPITSCVVEHADVDLSSLKKSQPLNGNTLIAKQALVKAITKHGRRMADTENYPCRML